MAERPDELDDSERIQHDIDRTREQMSGTIDEIRGTPARLRGSCTTPPRTVREAGVDSVKRVLSHAGRDRRPHRRSSQEPPPRRRPATRARTRCRRHGSWAGCGARPAADVRRLAPARIDHERRRVRRWTTRPPVAARRSTICTCIGNSRTGRAEHTSRRTTSSRRELDGQEFAGGRRRGCGGRDGGRSVVGEPAAASGSRTPSGADFTSSFEFLLGTVFSGSLGFSRRPCR